MSRVATLKTTKKAKQQVVLTTTMLSETSYGKELELKVAIEEVQGGKVRLAIEAPTCVRIQHTEYDVKKGM